MFLRSRSVATGLCAVLASLGATAAHATELDAGESQRIRVHGDIAEHCAISSPHDVDFGDLERAATTTDLKFGLDCNVPFVMRIEAQRGALTNLAYPQGQGPYAGSLPYVLDFAIPARSPALSMIRQSFTGHDLVAGKSISTHGAIATAGMNVQVVLGRVEGEAGLLAGNYGETITITLAAI